MPRFTYRTRIAAPAGEVFGWHERRGAFERLQPPWESVEVVTRSGGIRNGDRVILNTRLGPLSSRWVIEHRDYIAGQQFRDIQLEGPFRKWEHTHRVIPDGPSACFLEDDIQYELPLGRCGELLVGGLIESKLRRMFNYRHAVTADDVAAHRRARETQKLRVLASGASGLIGSTLVPLLSTGGHRVIKLERSSAVRPRNDAVWNTTTGRIDLPATSAIDAVVHLAGENIAGRWSSNKKRRILESRVQGTQQIIRWMQALERPPRVFVCASAIGYYGSAQDTLLTESDAAGEGFLADVCSEWEAAAAQANSCGTRVVCARFGVVLSTRGGALAKLLTPFKLGAGGIIGDGRQFWSWVGVDDAAGAVLHALQCDELSGPMNVVTPQPLTNREFTKTLGAVLGRPTILPLPRPAARLALGEMADELLLSSQRVWPERLLATQYNFRHQELAFLLRHLLGKPAPGQHDV